jgi:ATP-binding cassette, subfamily B, bacterial
MWPGASLRASFEHTPRTLRMVWASSRALCVGLGWLTLLAAILPLGVAWVGKAIVDAVVAGDRPGAIRWVLVELGLVAALALGQRGLGLSRQLLGARLSVDIHLAILDKARRLELHHFEDPEFYDRLTRARREASSRPVSVVVETFQLAQNALTLTGYVLLLVGYSGWAVLVLAGAAIPATIAEIRFSNAAFRLRNWRSPDSRKLNYLEHVLANDRHAKEVKSFGLGQWLLDRYRQLSETFYREDKALAVRRTGWAAGLSLLGTGAFYGLYLVMAGAAATGAMTVGELVLYLAAFRQGQQAFQSILSGLGGMYEHNLYMSNLFAYFDDPAGQAEVASPATRAPTDRPSEPESTERGIRFEGVTYRYPGRDHAALENVDLFIPEGGSVALVGPNGAGKSTFIKLLARLYEPTEGRILLDGKDLREWELEALLERIGIVFQDFVEYQFQLKDNIGLGHHPHLEDQERIERATDRGGAQPVVDELAAGYETQLGKWFKGGAQLSGGQWQKIALARAFMREEADILILDEPTAALDAEAEAALFERFRRLTEGRTSILISHRFPTVKMADEIVVLERGRIVEQGTHAELVAKGGRYARMYELQARAYREEPAGDPDFAS